MKGSRRYSHMFFPEYNDMVITHTEDGCTVSCDVNPRLLNPHGIVHGGVLYTLADTAGGELADRMLDYPVTMNSDFHFVSNVSEGHLVATPSVVHSGRHICEMEVTVCTEEGKLLAHGNFTYYNVDHRKN